MYVSPKLHPPYFVSHAYEINPPSRSKAFDKGKHWQECARTPVRKTPTPSSQVFVPIVFRIAPPWGGLLPSHAANMVYQEECGGECYDASKSQCCDGTVATCCNEEVGVAKGRD